MRKMLWTVMALSTLAVGCKKDKPKDPDPTMGGGAGNGSAMAAAMDNKGSGGSAATAPKTMTADDLVKRFHECWGFWGDAKWDDFKGCYGFSAASDLPGSNLPPATGNASIVDAAKAYRTAFPDERAASQLVLVNGKKIVAVALLTGKQSGPLKMPGGDMPATNNKFGLYMGQVLEIDDAGLVKHEADFVDMGTLMGQLKPMKEHPVREAVEKLSMPEQLAVGKDDAKEKANLATFQKLVESFNKHDAKAFGDLLADDVAWSEQAMAKDETKKELLANVPQMWKGFSDLKFTVGDSFAAGDYVAAKELFEGTNDGDLPMMHVKKTGKKVSLPFLAIHKLDGGKVKATWIFFQSGGFASQLGLDPGPKGTAPPKK